MSIVVSFVQEYGQILLVSGFGLVVLLILIVQFCLLRRVNRVQRKINSVTERVGNYLEVIMESEPAPTDENVEGRTRLSEEKMNREEEENRIISSVLQEIFP